MGKPSGIVRCECGKKFRSVSALKMHQNAVKCLTPRRLTIDHEKKSSGWLKKLLTWPLSMVYKKKL